VKGQFTVVALERHHDRSQFSCAVEPLDRYFREQVTQDIRRQVAYCYVAVHQPSGQLAAYYTLAAAGIPIGDLPPAAARKLPRYSMVPVVRIGRLAVDVAYRGRHLGSTMIADAARRTIHSGIGAYALVVDAKGEEAARFYLHHGFAPLGGASQSFYIAIAAFLRDARI
jgi:ribosomal protein S18 acetylase RimI-like enzyme